MFKSEKRRGNRFRNRNHTFQSEDKQIGFIKHFNQETGFGFVSPYNQEGDVLVHRSQLKYLHIITPLKGGEWIEYTPFRRSNGKLGAKDISLFSEERVDEENQRRWDNIPKEKWLKATFVFFHSEKGYGFVVPEGENELIFVHEIYLRKSGLDVSVCAKGTRVEIVVGFRRGREDTQAEEIRIL
ncbi:MAG: cold shock domain-containing protein [Candidatus Nomurabacteria bacterium]|nr:MAG: cold shock domain-containing protein [Candidatus Nomurabacteria bacterium]